MSEPAKCRGCGVQCRDAFCRRCWTLAPLWGKYELAWWLGEFRAGTTQEDCTFARAAWELTATWLGELIRAALQLRQAKRVTRKYGSPRRAKTLKELADEADANA